MKPLSKYTYSQALTATEDHNLPILQRVEMLMEIATGLHKKAEAPEEITDAIRLYERALELCPKDEELMAARLHARKASALQMYPSEDTEWLQQSKKDFERALPTLKTQGELAELAEVQMNFGLLLQTLADSGQAKLTDAMLLYQESLHVFTKEKYPAEYVILQNNLATAYLSLPFTDERARIKEALAVQSYRAALEAVTIEEHPKEYAMLQNNLGNALQYAASGHPIENGFLALAAYDEALKVRNAKDSPLSYANTICNKANCFCNLPDDPAEPEKGNPKYLEAARQLYKEAREIFFRHGEASKVTLIDDCLRTLSSELQSTGMQN